MSNPVLDEKRIMAILSGKVPHDSQLNITCRLQTGAIMAMIDAYDRKVDRDSFILCISYAMGLHTIASKRLLVTHLHELFRDDTLTDAQFCVAEAELNKMADTKLGELIEFVTKLAQCPVAGDSVN